MENRKREKQPTHVLICGKTGLLDLRTIQKVSESYQLTICGEMTFASGKAGSIPQSIHLYPDYSDEQFEKIMAAHSPDAVWYISGYADNGDGLNNETQMIRKLTEECGKKECQKLIVISSVNSLDDEGRDEEAVDPMKAFCCAQMEELVIRGAENHGVKVVLFRIPLISQDGNRHTWLGQQFGKLRRGEEVQLPGAENDPADFLSMENLAGLMTAVTEETMDHSACYTVRSGFRYTWKEIREKMLNLGGSSGIIYEMPHGNENRTGEPERENDRSVAKNYGFVATEDIAAHLSELYEEYVRAEEKKDGFFSKIRNAMQHSPEWILKTAELGILFAVMQLLLPLTSSSIYFRYVDLRLFFVVIIGCTYGMTMGILSGVLACVSLFFAYQREGITGLMLFYNVEFWFPFAIYLIAGAIIGYVMSSKDQKLKFAEEEIFSLQSKYLFLNRVYNSVISHKKEYKRQILGYHDSFGKIFEAVQNLDSMMPSDIFMRGIETMERILNNDSIAIYTLDDYQKYGRLMASSSTLDEKFRAKSLEIKKIQNAYDAVSSTGETWKNTEMAEGAPAYVSGITENGKVRLLICIWDAGMNQMNLYFMNLFTILCNLIRFSLIRADEYQQAIRREKYIAGTDVLKPEYFRKELEIQNHMVQNGVASYMQVFFPKEAPETVDAKLRGIVRISDIIGQNEHGDCCLLLSQMTKENFEYVEKRLEKSGLEYCV